MIAQRVRYHAVLGMMLVAGLAGSTRAQNAVGDGRALEAPLQTHGIPATAGARRNFANELAFREAVVSGNAPAGLSFRGEPEDMFPSRFEFRGELGEDALFAYRRDSLYSGLAGRGIRGTDALQYQFALATGAQIPSTLAGQFSYARAGAAERSTDPDHPLTRDLTNPGGGLRRANPDEGLLLEAVQTGSTLVQPVRSLSTYAANRGMQPTLVGLMQNRVTHQSAGQTASPLLGVQVVPLDSLRSPSALPAGRNGATGLPGATGTGGETGAPASKPAYETLIDRFRDLTPDEGALEETGVPEWAQDLLSVQRALRGVQTPAAPEPPTAGGDADPNPYEGFDGNDPGTLVDPGINANAGAGGSTFDAAVLRRVRQAGGVSEALIPTDLPALDHYSAYMQTGQELLAAERYFDAEEHFISAMTSRPRDVNALVGRAHAQIGAGLFLSAGLNVRQLLIRHPEISGMRYGSSLLPSPNRMEQVCATFRSNLESPSTGADSGLLLAYLGFQREREADILDGLAALEQWGDGADRRLAELLRVVWADQGAEDSASDDGG